MRRASLLIVFAVLVLALPGFAQQPEGDSSEAQEYEEDEFSPFLRNLRRGEIVMLGSFPLTLFLTLEAFDIYRYIENYGTSESYRYAFWPYRSPDPAPYSSGEIAGVIVTALSASLIIALADYIVGKVKQKRSED
jgi:hypothetical protein